MENATIHFDKMFITSLSSGVDAEDLAPQCQRPKSENSGDGYRSLYDPAYTDLTRTLVDYDIDTYQLSITDLSTCNLGKKDCSM